MVCGILLADNDGVLMAVFLAVGAACLLWFFLHIRARERAGKEPLISLGLFRNRTPNLGLVTSATGPSSPSRFGSCGTGDCR